MRVTGESDGLPADIRAALTKAMADSTKVANDTAFADKIGRAHV